jgi:hypothetical protein
VTAERDLSKLLAGLDPVRKPGEYVFVTTIDDALLPSFAMVVEDEGVSHVVERSVADERGLAYDLVCAWLTMRVHSSLDAVGMTAAMSAALTSAGISCNVIAGFHHDHLLVPADRADDAIAALRALAPPSSS